MRRALYIVFFLGVLACGLLLYWQRSRPEQSRAAPIAKAPAAVSLPPPRMAPTIPGTNADPLRLLPAVPRRESDNDTGRTVLNADPLHLVPAVPRRESDNDTGRTVLDEHSLMQQLRDSLLDHPRLAETLAREGRQRFPDSPEADERDALLVIALMNQRMIGSARMEAHYYFDHHRDGRFGDQVTYLTHVQPQPAGTGR
jgi:hypothetical protein